jgi:hypothetical protein
VGKATGIPPAGLSRRVLGLVDPCAVHGLLEPPALAKALNRCQGHTPAPYAGRPYARLGSWGLRLGTPPRSEAFRKSRAIGERFPARFARPDPSQSSLPRDWFGMGPLLRTGNRPTISSQPVTLRGWDLRAVLGGADRAGRSLKPPVPASPSPRTSVRSEG